MSKLLYSPGADILVPEVPDEDALSEAGLGLTLEEAYRIQLDFVAGRVAAGEWVIGKKIDRTRPESLPGQDEPGPVFGHLLSGMAYGDGDVILSGALATAFPVHAGDVVRMNLGRVGSVSARLA
jgi:2-keto-4-pentenoate hydratase